MPIEEPYEYPIEIFLFMLRPAITPKPPPNCASGIGESMVVLSCGPYQNVSL